ncbi:hypothetical protein AB0I37_13645 [Micromonospora purpureochromogenes]|uniref:hypothetical protein n=1 Tax=Micromonospora purpureochromogenes TaxID=47872 RepID=UPI0033D29B1D
MIAVVDAIDKLSRGRHAGQPIAALIITQDGKSTEKPLRLVAPYDLPVLSAALATT